MRPGGPLDPPSDPKQCCKDAAGPRAQAALDKWQWHVDEGQRSPREAFSRALAEKGIAEWPFLWPLEEAFAGTSVRIGGSDLELGITANLATFDRDDLVDEHDRIRFVPAGNDAGIELLHCGELTPSGGHALLPSRYCKR